MFVEAKFFHKAGVGSGGGSDPHNLGYYVDLTALQTAHPTGTDGDFAILGSTDTIWVWDSGTSAWKDTDTKGQVTSVNGQTGAVTLTIPDAVQYSVMPTADANNEGDIVQFTGTTDANYTNGYFYKCVSDGQTPATYSWTQTDVQPAPSGLPDQTGNSGKFLTTDGTDASWASALANTATNSQSLTIMGTGNTSQRAINVGYNSSVTSGDSLVIGYDAHATCSNSVAIGRGAYAWASYGYGYNCAVGNATVAGVNNGSISFCTALGTWAEAKAYGCIQIGNGTNTDAGTFKVALTTSGNSATNYELLSSNGTIPTDRLTKANTTVTLAVADWSSSTQTVSVTGVTATSIVLVAPDSASQSDYTSAGILCTAQGAGTLTFTCSTTPTNAITVNVVAL